MTGSHPLQPLAGVETMDRSRPKAPKRTAKLVRVRDGDPIKIVPMVAEVLATNMPVFVATGRSVLRAALDITKTLPQGAGGRRARQPPDRATD
jgi:hypothetical protein